MTKRLWDVRYTAIHSWVGTIGIPVEGGCPLTSYYVFSSSVLQFFSMYPAMGVALYRRGVMDNLAR